MYYLACFIVSLLTLLWAIAINENMKINQILLIVITVIGNGGYYALAESSCLETAILANKLTYLIGIFSPMLIFFNICEICKMRMRHFWVVTLYTIQILIYLCVCTIGKSNLFYETVEFHEGRNGAFLTKTYGPAHDIYIVMLFLYLAMCMWITAQSWNKKNKVSYKTADILIFMGILTTGTYFIERALHLEMDFVPFVFTIGLIAILVPVTKTSWYSVEENRGILESKLEGMAYIVFSKKLQYMGCNEYAGILFPELLEWELEKKIPGNGGRFNTFLRQTFMKFVVSNQEEPLRGTPFSIKERTFHYFVKRLYSNRKKHLGYVIELIDVTELANGSV